MAVPHREMEITTNGDAEEPSKKQLLLEENVTKLRKALQHWQVWEVEYAELKDAIEALPQNATPVDLKSTGESLESSLVIGKELEDVLGSWRGKRSRAQVISCLSRRVDYVQQNAQSAQKQLDKAEKELESALSDDVEAISPRSPRSPGGHLPILDIIEELDEDGEVVSSSVSKPQDSVPQVVNVLKNAGVTGLEISDREETTTGRSSDDNLDVSKSRSSESSTEATDSSSATLAPGSGPQSPSKKRKKSVSFAEEVSISPAPSARRSSPPPQVLPPTPLKAKSKVPWEVEESRKGRFFSGTRVIEVDETDKEIGSLPVVAPEDESPEDAALRREMNQYALSEVGAIVAEMDIEEGDGDDEDDDELDDNPDFDGSNGGEDENEYGISMHDRVSDEDRQAMLDLEKKLSARMMNVGPQPESDGLKDYANDVRKLVIRSNNGDENAESNVEARPVKKGVHFAEEPDTTPSPARLEETEAAPLADPVSDAVIERNIVSQSINKTKSTTKANASRFKKGRLQQPLASEPETSSRQDHSLSHRQPNIPVHLRQDSHQSQEVVEPEGPPGKTLSSTVVERQSRENAAPPPNPSGADPALLEQELAVENRRLFNKMIQKQGGFKPSQEEVDSPLMEERDGKIRKVSRFKAAKLNAENPE